MAGYLTLMYYDNLWLWGISGFGVWFVQDDSTLMHFQWRSSMLIGGRFLNWAMGAS